ncbi:MAG: hypothetical protein C0505_17350 [Leptothrix sp. (in: Bacteria)]|nr:hypothetical protein [Leptothrix sp. (in: b-proteobacteria)]
MGAAALACGLAGLVVLPAAAKSLYIIANINASPTPIRTYDIQGAPNHLVFQATQNVPAFAGGAVGLGLDSASKKLFVTYEGSNVIQLLDAQTFANLGTTTAPGAGNLAGIVVDQGKGKVYTVDRETNRLYVYTWTPATNTLTLDGGTFKALAGVSQANGIALDESRGRLYIGDRSTTTVRYFDTTSWLSAGSIVLAACNQTVQGIAVDSARNVLFTGNAYGPYGSRGRLCKYDLNANAESFYTLPGAPVNLSSSGDNIVGVAVDEDTGNVYASTGNQGTGGTDTLIVFDPNLGILKNDLGRLGNPTGIAIAETSFNPLNLSKAAAPEPVVSGANLSFSVCYDNLLNPLPVNNVVLVDELPAGTAFVSASGGGAHAAGVVTWTLGSLPGNAPQACQSLVAQVTASAGSVLLNRATIDSDDTPPTSRTTRSTVIAGAQVCDVDRDGDIDKADLALISRARGQLALPGDARDADGDGLITPSDVKVCIPRCTRAGCAIQ